MSYYANDKQFWEKEFPQSSSKLKTGDDDKAAVATVVKEYAKYCTLHGIQYVFKENATIVERVVWSIIVLTSLICASLLMNTMWTEFSMSPTMTAVKDTHLPLHALPFPAVSICSTDKIKRQEAYDYLKNYVNLTDPEILESVDHFLTAMSLFQHPLYSRSSPYFEKSGNILPLLSSVNLTDFMLNVGRKCSEIFNKCFWIGKPIDCCDLFKLQRSEEGFCFAFNSLTSHSERRCRRVGAFLHFHSDGTPCTLRRNTAAGSSTGLEIYLKEFNVSDRIIDANETIGIPGHRVQIFYVSEYPEASMGTLIPSQRSLKLSLMIKPSITKSTDSIRHLDINDRFCYFPDEQRLSVSAAYSQKSCLIECRLKHLKNVCHCRPYYFNLIDNTIPVCNSTQISCVAEHNSELVFFSPPSVEIRGFNDSNLNSLLNCSQCLPTCHESIYDIDTLVSEDTAPLAKSSFGDLDLFYRNEGAVLYQRDVTFGWVDLLVSFGGIAGLFLGFSLLSIVEFAYWGIKITMHQISWYISGRERTPKIKNRLLAIKKRKKEHL